MGCFQRGEGQWNRGVMMCFDDTLLLSYVQVEGRAKSEFPVLCTQPVRPCFCTSCLTFLLAARVSWALTSWYRACVSASSTAGALAMRAICAASNHVFLRQILLAPLGSICFLPCKTPPIRVSCHEGVNTALRLLATAFSWAATLLRLHVNSLCVDRTLRGCHL